MTRFHEKTTDAARGKWRGILMTLGVPAASLTGKHGPCPLCGSKDNFRWDNKEGSGSFICTCRAGTGMQLVQEVLGVDFREAAARIDGIVGNIKLEDAPAQREMSHDDRVAALRRVYGETRPIAPGDAAHRYLAGRRIEELIYPKSLRFHPGLKDGEGGIRPAMVAMVGVHGEAKMCSMHRTFLRPDGSAKADMEAPKKLMPGPLPDGACVMLSDWTGSGAIGIAEGIETAMSASAMFGLPVWAAISSRMMEKWMPPEGADEVAIFGDNDPKFGGQASAYVLAHRIATRLKIPVTVHIPPVTGMDWADEHMARLVDTPPQ